jgi:8-oxo-dGTP diphosphatase
MTTPSDPIHVSAGILVRNGKILACQRRADQSHAGRWEFPGGKLEAGETLAACLRRELREELGIEAEIGAEVWRTQHAYAERTVALHFFRVATWRGAIANLVFAAVRWVPARALRALDFLEADRELIRRLDAGEIALGNESE